MDVDTLVDLVVVHVVLIADRMLVMVNIIKGCFIEVVANFVIMDDNPRKNGKVKIEVGFIEVLCNFVVADEVVREDNVVGKVLDTL